MKRTAPLSDARSLSRVDLISLGVLLGILTGASRADAGRTDAGASEEAPRSRTIDVADSSSLRRALGDAEPGTTILLAPGDYEGGLSVEGPRGTAEEPIVIASKDPKKPARILGGGSALQLTDPAYVTIRDLVIEDARGNGLNIDDGGSFETPARGVTLRNLTVRRVGPGGNRDGIKLSGVVDFRVENCTIEEWGDGGSGIDLVGCHDGLIVDSTFRHDDPEGANGVQAKGGSRNVTVRRCRFERAGGRGVNLGGSTGLEYFRPRPEGYEAKDIVVEDSIFIGTGAPVAFVGVDGAVVRHNTIWRPRRWVVRILQETRGKDFVPSRRGIFEKNIICFRTDEVRTIVNVGPDTAPETFTFARNVWYVLDAPDRTRAAVRGLPAEEREGRYGIDPKLVDPKAGDFTLTEDSPARDAGPRRIPEVPEKDRDTRADPDPKR